MYFWAGVVIYLATAWRVVVEGNWPSSSPQLNTEQSVKASEPARRLLIDKVLPTPHLRVSQSVKSKESEKSYSTY
jgi:hypothetical protein